MAEHIKADGARAQVQPQDGRTFSLQELQAAVGGYIEIVGLADGRYMVLNEEGKLQHLEVNAEATRLARSRIGADDYIVGDVLVCTDRELEGEEEEEEDK